MTMPGFTAAMSLYKTPGHYVTTANSPITGAVPQLAAGGGWSQLDECRLLCECCRYYWGCCFACWYCAIIILWPYGVGETAA